MATHQNEEKELRDLFPEIDPYDTGRLKVSSLHELSYEQCGKPDGKPVLFLHGGPGSGYTPRDRRWFDPTVYRIVLLDQRGAGKSTPAAEIKDNTIWRLVEDIEALRTHLNIDKWVVFGGSWGSTLALVYSECHPDSVKAIILRGIFLGTKEEDDWMYKEGGASCIYPDVWDEFISVIPPAERRSLLDAYYRRLTSEDVDEFTRCARLWNKMELVTSKILPDEEQLKRAEEDDVWSLQHARIECHYFLHGLFFDKDTWILDNVDKIRHIPATIIQGRYDITCPMLSAWRLHKVWPEAEFQIIQGEGHSTKTPLILHNLVLATEKFKHL